MKKVLCMVILIIALCGCHKVSGSFEKGDMDMRALMEKINQKTIRKNWEFPLMLDDTMETSRIEETYQMDMTKIEASFVSRSVVDAEMGEVAFFKCDPQYDAIIEEALQAYKQAKQTEWKYFEEAENVVMHALQGRIGQYYYFILGEDNQKVVDYIQELKRS